jgi:transposase-like protein
MSAQKEGGVSLQQSQKRDLYYCCDIRSSEITIDLNVNNIRKTRKAYNILMKKHLEVYLKDLGDGKIKFG